MAEYLRFHRESSHTRERLFFTPRTAERGPAPQMHKDYQLEVISPPSGRAARDEPGGGHPPEEVGPGVFPRSPSRSRS
jgi:hypothetical protein